MDETLNKKNPEVSRKNDFHSGYVAVVGLPNVGKSTFLNQLLQYKISIVSHKPQTTRKNVIGILHSETYQIVFIDTPGILQPRYNLQTAMMKYVRSAISDADVLIYMIDACGKRQAPRAVQEQLRAASGRPVILALNKIDLLPDKRNLLPLIEQYSQVYSFQAIVPISARRSKGLDRLVEEVVSCLPLGPPYYPSDFISDQQERFFVSEIIREKIFKLYGKEIPYSCHVEIEEFQEQPGEKDYIRAAVIIEKSSQKSIIIGKGGKALKKVGEIARREIESFLGRPVFLEIFVKVKQDWRKKDSQLKNFGF